MDPDQIGAPKNCGGHGRTGAAQPIVHLPSESAANEALARGPDRERPSQTAELVQTPQDLQIVLRQLAEADPRVQNDLITLDSRPPSRFQDFPEKIRDFRDDVAILR